MGVLVHHHFTLEMRRQVEQSSVFPQRNPSLAQGEASFPKIDTGEHGS